MEARRRVLVVQSHHHHDTAKAPLWCSNVISNVTSRLSLKHQFTVCVMLAVKLSTLNPPLNHTLTAAHVPLS
jgi:hypothetical protein